MLIENSITWANWKVKVKVTVERKKMIAGVVFELNHVGAPCCKTWLKFEVAGIKVAIAKKI